MLTPLVLLAVVINIAGLLNNYNIKHHQLDIRVKRDDQAELQYDDPLQLLNETTNDILDRNTSHDAPEHEEVTKEQDTDVDVAYTVEDDLLFNYTGYNEAENDEVIKEEDIAPKKNTFDVNLASDSLLNESDNRFEMTDKMIRNESEFMKNATEEPFQEELDKELMNSIPEYNNSDVPETVAIGVKVLLINKIAGNLFKEQSDREDENFDAKQEIEMIKELDDKLTNLKNYENNNKQEELTKYDNEVLDYKRASILLDIILNLRDDNVDKETIDRGKRYAPYGDGSFSAPPNNMKSGDGWNRRGVDPGYVGNYTAYSGLLSNFNSNYRQYTQSYPNNVNLYPNNNLNGRNTNYIHYNRNSTHQYNNFNNQQTYNNNFTNRTYFPTYPINRNPSNINQTYRAYNSLAPYNNQTYFYNGYPGYYQSYQRMNPYGGNQKVPAHSTNGSGIYTSNFYNNYYPIYNQSSNANRNASDGHRAPGSNGNGTLTSNSTTAAPDIMRSCIMCGSVGCPNFFRKMGFFCVPLDEQ